MNNMSWVDVVFLRAGPQRLVSGGSCHEDPQRSGVHQEDAEVTDEKFVGWVADAGIVGVRFVPESGYSTSGRTD